MRSAMLREKYSHDNVLNVVLSSQWQDGGEGSGSGYEREDDGHDGGGASWPLVLEYLYIQNHLAGQYEDDNRAGYGKGLDVHAEEWKYGVSEKQEQQEYDGWEQRGFPGFDFKAFVLEANDDRGRSSYVYYGEQDHKGTEYLFEIKIQVHFLKISQ